LVLGAVDEEVRISTPPSHTGVLLVAVTSGAGVTDTADDAVADVPQPLANTLISAVPLKVEPQVTVPVVEVPLMLLPVPDTDHV
jgi:hypothetical protein